MSIVRVRDNENNRRKRNAKKTTKKKQKQKRIKRGVATVKWWELNDFVVHLS